MGAFLTRDELGDLDLEAITLIEGAPLPVLAKACRGALIASDNKELYAADFKAIEARKLAWMAGCASQLELFRNNGDPYLAMASAIYNREITKKDKAERQLGKKAVLGLGYNMGWEKFQSTVWNEDGIWLDDDFCKKVVNIYRKNNVPKCRCCGRPSRTRRSSPCRTRRGIIRWRRPADRATARSATSRGRASCIVVCRAVGCSHTSIPKSMSGSTIATRRRTSAGRRAW